MTITTSLVSSVAMTWVMTMVAALSRERVWTAEGLVLAFGNRAATHEPSPFVGRAERAARNMLENLVLFGGVVVAASVAQVSATRLAVPCAVFVGSRAIYGVVYWLGIPYARTVAWAVSVGAIVWIGAITVLR